MLKRWILRLIFYFFLLSILIFIKVYDDYKTNKEYNRHRSEHPLIKKSDCINDVVKFKSIKTEHIDLSKVQVDLMQLSGSRTIYAFEYSGNFKYDIYSTVEIGDSVIKKCNSDSLIIKHDNRHFYFKIIDDWDK